MKLSEIKAEAKHALKGQCINAICMFLLFYLICSVAGYINIPLIYVIIYVPLSFGLVISFIKLKRGEKINIFNFLKEGFSRFSKSFGIAWHTFLKLFLHLILGLIIFLIIPLLLSYIAYSTNTDLSKAPILGMSGLIVLVFSLPILSIWIYPKYLFYVLAYNISYDNPELSSKECVLKSAQLMKGNRKKYFLLQLYFIVLLIVISYITSLLLLMLLTIINTTLLSPNFIIPIILLGCISYIFVYMRIATICFYDRLVEKK